jgi:hypothetical protein
MNIALASQGLYLSFKTDSFLKKGIVTNGNTNESGIISFSKDKKNIVLFIADGAQGWYMNEIIRENPELEQVYDGFIWYPNALSTSNFTYSSVPAMMCGNDFTIENLNKDNTKSITQKITDVTKLFLKNIKKEGYNFTSTKLKYSKIDTESFDTYLSSWHSTWSKKIGLNKQEEIWYTRLCENALFSCSPLFLKAKIYNNRQWIFNGDTDVNLTELNKYNFVKVLPKISNTASDKPSFIYIHSMFTHVPWNFITEDNKLEREVSPYKTQKWFTNEFTNWIKWMKDNGVYNNTKIILVSDHGPSWSHYTKKIENDFPVEWNTNFKMSYQEYLRLNPLILIKDYYRNGTLKTDGRLMSNADTYAIAFDKNDPTKIDSSSRTLRTYYTWWHKDLHDRVEYSIKHQYEVTDYIFDLKNWNKIK